MKDQLQRTLKFETIPSRIICLVPSLTEMLVDLGLEERIVGVTKFCVHPKHIRKTVEIVGGTKTIKSDKIESLNPDFILANKEENDIEVIEKLSKSYPVYVSDIEEIEDLSELIRNLSDIFKIQDKGYNLIKNIQTSFIKFSDEMKNMPRLKVAYFIWKDPWMVAGSSTFINYMLFLNNFENIYDRMDRYPEIDIEDLKPVDYVFLSSEPFPFKKKHVSELRLPANKIKIVDGEYFSWYGSRLIKAFDYFRKLRYNL